MRGGPASLRVRCLSLLLRRLHQPRGGQRHWRSQQRQQQQQQQRRRRRWKHRLRGCQPHLWVDGTALRGHGCYGGGGGGGCTHPAAACMRARWRRPRRSLAAPRGGSPFGSRGCAADGHLARAHAAPGPLTNTAARARALWTAVCRVPAGLLRVGGRWHGRTLPSPRLRLYPPPRASFGAGVPLPRHARPRLLAARPPPSPRRAALRPPRRRVRRSAGGGAATGDGGRARVARAAVVDRERRGGRRGIGHVRHSVGASRCRGHEQRRSLPQGGGPFPDQPAPPRVRRRVPRGDARRLAPPRAPDGVAAAAAGPIRRDGPARPLLRRRGVCPRAAALQAALALGPPPRSPRDTSLGRCRVPRPRALHRLPCPARPRAPRLARRVGCPSRRAHPARADRGRHGRPCLPRPAPAHTRGAVRPPARRVAFGRPRPSVGPTLSHAPPPRGDGAPEPAAGGGAAARARGRGGGAARPRRQPPSRRFA